MFEHGTPVRFEYGDDGSVVQILLHERWYDAFAPVVRWLDPICKVVAIDDPGDVFDRAAELIHDLILHFEIKGWVLSISLLAVLSLAVDRGVSIVKFTYTTRGFGEFPYGFGPFGGGPIVETFPSTT